MSIDQVHASFISRDPLLMAALYSGDERVVEAVFRLLRLTPLHSLARHPAALAEVLAAMPDHHCRLRSCWARQDPAMTATLFGWAEQARLRVRRADHDAARVASIGRVPSIMRSEELAASC